MEVGRMLIDPVKCRVCGADLLWENTWGSICENCLAKEQLAESMKRAGLSPEDDLTGCYISRYLCLSPSALEEWNAHIETAPQKIKKLEVLIKSLEEEHTELYRELKCIEYNEYIYGTRGFDFSGEDGDGGFAGRELMESLMGIPEETIMKVIKIRDNLTEIYYARTASYKKLEIQKEWSEKHILFSTVLSI